MASKQQRKRSKPAKSAEPTVAQQRQSYYEARARRKALEELGVVDADAPRPAPDKRAALEALDAFDRLMVLYGVCRWTALSGAPPEPEDWEGDSDWPQPDAVGSLFGSWDDALAESGVLDSTVPAMLDRVATAQRDLVKRAEGHERHQRRLEEEAQRIPELERQMKGHKARRDEADLRVREVEGERERLVAERKAAGARAEALSARVAELEAAAADAAQRPAGDAEDPWIQELEGALAAHASSEAQRDELHERMERLRAEREADRRTIAELSQLLARVDSEGADGGSEDTTVDEDPPASVLEAVQRAAAGARHLRFAPRAFETAADSPFRRPGLVLRTLRQLDELAGRYDAGDMGMSLSSAAQQVGITQWKAGVSELARTRWRDEYTLGVDGHEVELGPHVGLGSGSGAGFVARIYMHVADGAGADGLPRGITVGVVGRHLPDTTT